MSANSPSDTLAVVAATSSKNKKRSKKKKVNTSKVENVVESHPSNGHENGKVDVNTEDEDRVAGDIAEPDSEDIAAPPDAFDVDAVGDEDVVVHSYKENGATVIPEAVSPSNNMSSNDMDTESRLETMAKERDMLKAEVTELRKSLENIQAKHIVDMDETKERYEEEVDELREQLEESQAGKEHAEMQHRNLLGKINTIKSQLGERLKQDADELAQARSKIESLEEYKFNIIQEKEALEGGLHQSRREIEVHLEEIAHLRSRTNLSQQNWIKERDDLVQREAYAREEFENAKQAMQDWEVLAMEERSLRESLGERVSELEEHLSSLQDSLERTTNERATQSQTVDGLQRALKEIQDARKKELRELVESSQQQLDEAQRRLQEAEKSSIAAKAELDTAKIELQRTAPFEKEVKEKSLQLGKLRHEAVILNSHLTKALRMLKKGKPEDNIDRQIVSTYFIQFLALDRSDPKKFQILQLIASLLGWSDEQREQAGLSRPGASNSNLRIPISPFRRTPSTPSLSTEAALMTESGNSKESLAELWSNFLEQEAANGFISSPTDNHANSEIRDEPS